MHEGMQQPCTDGVRPPTSKPMPLQHPQHAARPPQPTHHARRSGVNSSGLNCVGRVPS